MGGTSRKLERKRERERLEYLFPKLFPHPCSFGAVAAFLPEKPHLLPDGYSSFLRFH